MAEAVTQGERVATPKRASDPWADLTLTLPFFVIYHLGVIFLPVRNAADLVTQELAALANHSLLAYGGLTLAVGAVYVGILLALGRGHALHWNRFLFIALEGVLYAFAMRLVASYVVGRLRLLTGDADGPFTGAIMSLGAGFYEEIAFRVILFGLGAKLLGLLFASAPSYKTKLITIAWGLASAAIFSGWHYVGPLGDPFELRSFVFRWVCGLAFVVIYSFRGFAPAVWTHALYDVWVLVL
ncbi:MAG: CPBP family glutamic-type intramembrane protease [Sorangiineae bacterium]|nr:CPBP family glutamic-type intramembrane protease [Polyangiaceae bacterium]MEB2322554.1 CPBP family glutamic-type intramembrane protease [Sorangiineae bacterium]